MFGRALGRTLGYGAGIRPKTGMFGLHYVNDIVWYPRYLSSPFFFSTPHAKSILIAHISLFFMRANRFTKCIPPFSRLFVSLMSHSIPLSCRSPFELASMSECGEFLLRRNPKLMVNYIRPVTELGLERARRLPIVSSIRKIAESVEARTFPDTRPVGKRSPLSRMTLSLGARVHERSGIVSGWKVWGIQCDIDEYLPSHYFSRETDKIVEPMQWRSNRCMETHRRTLFERSCYLTRAIDGLPTRNKVPEL
ncbi:hypothetical protein V1478_012605 [Vespula squamosa]|uniref:Uncharacterized protein n=1 Tax=Vespula squamosa TaxID=30214 RepID=A0ABD2ADM4_VESSQ